MNKETSPEIHIGFILKQYIDAKKIYKSALARSLGVNDSAVVAYQKRAGLQTGTLIKLSHALKHNFFADVAALLPKTYTSSIPTDQTESEKIAKLELEITILKAEKAVLLQAMGSK